MLDVTYELGWNGCLLEVISTGGTTFDILENFVLLSIPFSLGVASWLVSASYFDCVCFIVARLDPRRDILDDEVYYYHKDPV
jgi:hypothetical protein